MNSQVLPQNLLEQMVIYRDEETIYLLFDTELARAENSLALLMRSLSAALTALGVHTPLDIDPKELLAMATKTTSPKLLVKHSFTGSLWRSTLFERD